MIMESRSTYSFSQYRGFHYGIMIISLYVHFRPVVLNRLWEKKKAYVKKVFLQFILMFLN